VNLARRPQLYDAVTILALLAVTGSAFVALVVLPSPTRAATASGTLLSDDFTHDTSLNTNLWQINGSVGSVFGLKDMNSSTTVLLEPTLSSAGMRIAQVNGKFEVGTIQSVESFTPPFTATATVDATVSNGHTFSFAISSADASSGVVIWGNVNDTNCSNQSDCGNPEICGNTANPEVTPPNQCYYGIDAKTGSGGAWAKKPKLFLTPTVNVTYTLQISVDASGNARYSVGQGGETLGQSTANVGTRPFYIIMEQGEGAPVGGGRDNVAYWKSVAVTLPSTSSSTSITSTTPGPSSSGISISIQIAIVVAVIVILLLIILLWYRRRKLIVALQDSKTLSPILGALVSASGPKNLSGTTRNDGKVVFTNPKKGDYSIQAKATGYNSSIPVMIKVKEDKTECVIKLDRIDRGQPGQGGAAPSQGPGPQPQVQTPVAEVTQIPAPSAPMAAGPAAPQPSQQELPEFEGWGGERIRQIIKTFQEKGAISPETALTAKELGLSRMFVRIMQRRKGQTIIFMEINGKYYLNQEAFRKTGQ